MPTARRRPLIQFLAAALIGSAVCASCKDSVTAPLATTFTAQFEAFWKAFDANYSYFDYKHVDWNRQRTAFRLRAERVTTQDSLLDLLTLMVAPLRDAHVKFIDPYGGEISTYERNALENWDPSVSAQMLSTASFVQVKPKFGYGRIRGVGYIQIAQWDDSTITIRDLDEALSHFRDESRLIIDVRMNGGGSDSLAYNFAARFNAVNRVVGYYQYRDGPSHEDFDPVVTRILGVRGPFRFSGRVLVLAGRYSYSACESFVAAMRELPNVTIVGDTTGGSGRPQAYDIGAGFKILVPRWIEYTAQHRAIEWNGVAPNLYVAWDRALARQGHDSVLETALGLLGASPN